MSQMAPEHAQLIAKYKDLLDKYNIPESSRLMQAQYIHTNGKHAFIEHQKDKRAARGKESAARKFQKDPTLLNALKRHLFVPLKNGIKGQGADFAQAVRKNPLDPTKGYHQVEEEKNAEDLKSHFANYDGVHAPSQTRAGRPGVFVTRTSDDQEGLNVVDARGVLGTPIVIVKSGQHYDTTTGTRGTVHGRAVDLYDVTNGPVSVIKPSTSLKQWLDDHADFYLAKTAGTDELGDQGHYLGAEAGPQPKIGISLAYFKAILVEEDEFEIIDPGQQVVDLAVEALSIGAGAGAENIQGLEFVGNVYSPPRKILETMRKQANIAKDAAEMAQNAEDFGISIGGDPESKLGAILNLEFARVGGHVGWQGLPHTDAVVECRTRITITETSVKGEKIDEVVAWGVKIGDIRDTISKLVPAK